MTTQTKTSNLARRLRRLRETHRMTRKDLADIVGVTETAIYNYESGRRTPENDTLEKLAEAFGVTLSELRDDAGTVKTIKDELIKAKEKLRRNQERVATTTVPKMDDITALAETTRRISFLEKSLAEIAAKATPAKTVPIVNKPPTKVPVLYGDPGISEWLPVREDSDIDYALIVPDNGLKHVGIVVEDLALVHHRGAAQAGELVVTTAGDVFTLKYYDPLEAPPVVGVVRRVLKQVPKPPDTERSGP